MHALVRLFVCLFLPFTRMPFAEAKDLIQVRSLKACAPAHLLLLWAQPLQRSSLTLSLITGHRGPGPSFSRLKRTPFSLTMCGLVFQQATQVKPPSRRLWCEINCPSSPGTQHLFSPQNLSFQNRVRKNSELSHSLCVLVSLVLTQSFSWDG